LKLWGIKDIVEAGDGKDALLKPYWNDVDLVISDWRMPEMNGLEFYRQAKEDGLLENVPVLMVYAEKEKVKVIEAAKEVISYYVIKSIDLMVMQGKIRKLPKRPD
jgi:two-component system chemotaxis response regulator CheY